jgi:retron-type reverse transcriptase
MQAKLHRWAAADPGRRFDDLLNFVHDPATLIMAFDRVAGNRDANTPGVDGLTVAEVSVRSKRRRPGRPARSPRWHRSTFSALNSPRFP